jgi:hypothetical protein
MKVVAVLAVLAGLGPQDDPAERQLAIRRALTWMGDPDAELRQIGRRQLLDFGRQAVPAIEQNLKDKGVFELVALLREIERPAPSEAAPYAFGKDVNTELEALKDLPKLEAGASDRFVNVKYQEALRLATKGQYQKGYDLARALETLEPKAAAADKVRKLRRYCENMITQTTLLEAKLLQAKPAYAADEPVVLTMRLRNLFRHGITVQYEKGTPAEPGFGQVVVEIEVQVTNFYNEQMTFTKSQTVKVETEIPIAPGAQWEGRFPLDTALELKDNEEIRVFTVNAWTQPLKVETEGRDLTRRIQFEPAVVKIVPPKYAHFMDNPLESLGKSIDGRPAQETFLCSQLLAPEQKEAALEMLIRAMHKTPNEDYRKSLSWILMQMTGEKLGPDPRKWSEWKEGRAKGPKK